MEAFVFLNDLEETLAYWTNRNQPERGEQYAHLPSKVCAFVPATLIPSSLRWILLFAVLIVPQVLWGAASAPATPQPTPGKTWLATVGA